MAKFSLKEKALLLIQIATDNINLEEEDKIKTLNLTRLKNNHQRISTENLAKKLIVAEEISNNIVQMLKHTGEMKNLIDDLAEILSPRESKILFKYLVERKSKKEIGEEYEVRTERINQVLTKALRKIREYSK